MKTILAIVIMLFSLSSFAGIDYSKEAMDARCGDGQEMIYWNKIAKTGAEVKVCLNGDMVSGGFYMPDGDNMVYTSPLILTHVQVTKDYEAVIVQNLPMAFRFQHKYDGRADYAYLFDMGTESENSRPVALDPTLAYSNIIGLREAKRGTFSIDPVKPVEKKAKATQENTQIKTSDAVGDRCAPGDIVFYGKTVKGNKEVLVCRWNNNVFYRFGKIGKKPDMDLKEDISNIGVANELVSIPNGDVYYHTGYEDGREVLIVSRGKDTLATIDLDQRSVVNNIKALF